LGGVQINTEKYYYITSGKTHANNVKIYPGVSNKIEEIIKKSTQKNKTDRYQSCDEFKKALENKNYIKHTKSPSSKTSSKKPKQSGSKRSVLFLMILIMGIGILGFLTISKNNQKNENNLDLIQQENEQLKHQVEQAQKEAEASKLAKIKAEKEARLAKIKAEEKARNVDNSNNNSSTVGCIYGDCANGYGTFIYDSGDKYVGEWKDHKRHGQGTYTFGPKSDYAGDIYIGQSKNNAWDGKGTYTWPNGHKYVGKWKDGKQNGFGSYTWPDGDRYAGSWKDDKRHGEGAFYPKNGKKKNQSWDNGEQQ